MGYKNRLTNKDLFNFDRLYSNSTNFKYIPDASTIYMISDKAFNRIKADEAKNLNNSQRSDRTYFQSL
jgi:hypothetical protein